MPWRTMVLPLPSERMAFRPWLSRWLARISAKLAKLAKAPDARDVEAVGLAAGAEAEAGVGTEAAVEGVDVVARPAVEPVVATVAVQPVRARAAEERVVPEPAIDEVVAGSAIEPVGVTAFMQPAQRNGPFLRRSTQVRVDATVPGRQLRP